jgi:hypothetical protein
MWAVIDYVVLGLGFVWLGWFWLRAQDLVWSRKLWKLPKPQFIRFWLVLASGLLLLLVVLIQHVATGSP